MQTGNQNDFLSLDFGLTICGEWNATTRLHYYRRYVDENGALPTTKGAPIDPKLVDTEAQKGFALMPTDRLLYRTRYFTDSGVIGTKAFILRCAQLFESRFTSRHPKQPQPIAGIAGVYSLKRLSELICVSQAPSPACVSYLRSNEGYTVVKRGGFHSRNSKEQRSVL